MANSENYVWTPATRLVQRDLFFIYRNDQITGNRTELQSDTRFAASTALRIVGGLDWSNNQLERGTRGAGALPGAVFNVQPVNPNLGNTPLQFERRVPQADANIVTVAPFMEALFEPIKQVKIIGGLRHDRIDIDRRDRITQSNSTSKSYSPTTRRLGLVWSVTNTTNLYAGYATSADPVQQFVSLSSAQSDLSLQRGKQAEVGLKQSTADGRFDWTAAVYSIRKTDLVQTVTVAPGITQTQTVGEQRSKGIELATAWRPLAALRLDLNLAYTDAEFERFLETASGNNLDRSGKTAPNVPKWLGNAFVSYKVTERVVASGGVRYVGSRFANNANLIKLDAYTTWDAAVEYRERAWSLGVRGRNLSNKVYADWAINSGLQQRLGDPRTVELYVRFKI